MTKIDIDKIYKRNMTNDKYSIYEKNISKLIPWIIEQVNKSPDKILRLRIIDIKKEMGPELEDKNDTDMYWGLKFVLYKHGINVELGSTKNDEKILKMKIIRDSGYIPKEIYKAKIAIITIRATLLLRSCSGAFISAKAFLSSA